MFDELLTFLKIAEEVNEKQNKKMKRLNELSPEEKNELSNDSVCPKCDGVVGDLEDGIWTCAECGYSMDVWPDD